MHRFIHKKFTGRSRFCRNYPLSYACTKRNDLPLFSPSPFFKHTQAEDPDPYPGQGLLSSCAKQFVSASISLPCQREVARAQPVTEGFRPQESCPKTGIPQSASLTAPFHKGATVEKILQCSQKIHPAVTILPQLSGILSAYQERNQDISPITLSPLQTHTGKRP